MLYYKSPLKILTEIQQEKRRKMFLFEMIVARILLKEGIDDDPFLSMFTKQAKAIGALAGEAAQAGTHLLSALGKFAVTVKAILNDEPPEYLKKNLRKANEIRQKIEDKIEKITPESQVTTLGMTFANLYLGGAPLGATAAQKIAGFIDDKITAEGSFKDNLLSGLRDRSYGETNIVDNLKELISDYENYCDDYPSQKKGQDKSLQKFANKLEDVNNKIKKLAEKANDKPKIFKFFNKKVLTISSEKDDFLSFVFFGGENLSIHLSSIFLDSIYNSLMAKRPTSISKIERTNRTNTGKTGTLKISFDKEYASNETSELIDIIIEAFKNSKVYENLNEIVKQIELGVINFDKSPAIEEIDTTKNPYKSFYERLSLLLNNQKEARKIVERKISRLNDKDIIDYEIKRLQKKIGKIMVKIKAEKDAYENRKDKSKQTLCEAVEKIKKIIDSQKTSE